MQQLFPNWCGFNLNSVAFYYFCSRWFDNDIILYTLYLLIFKKFFRTISIFEMGSERSDWPPA